jgi:hypothetical protein
MGAIDPAAVAVKALEHISDQETESGVEHLFNIPMPSRHLSDQEQSRIIVQFNGPPLIAADQRHQFKLDWEPLLRYVLVRSPLPIS